MPKVLGFDIETTGLDVANDRIIEVGAAVWCTEDKVPLEMFSCFVMPNSVSHQTLSPEITKLTGIKQEWIERYGEPLTHAVDQLNRIISQYDVEYVVAHNGENYDKPLYCAEVKRLGVPCGLAERLPWIDTRQDLPFREEPQSRRLTHLATDHGFLNPFQHRALFDVLTMLRVMSFYDFNDIVKLSQVPWVTLRALVDYDNREKAKELRYGWEQVGDKKYPKCWVKRVRANRVEEETAQAAAKGFKSVRIE